MQPTIKEGNSSYIIIDPITRTATKKRKRYNEASLMSEYTMHRFVEIVLSAPKYKIIYTPTTITYNAKEYIMDAINDGYLIMAGDYDDKLTAELQEFYRDMRHHTFFPHDFELYLQPDGRVAMVDFDKFGQYDRDGMIIIDSINRTYSVERLLKSPLLPVGFTF
jgi:hypothetical protein